MALRRMLNRFRIETLRQEAVSLAAAQPHESDTLDVVETQTPPPKVTADPVVKNRVIHGVVTPAFIDGLRGHGVLAYTNKTRPPKYVFYIQPDMAATAREIPFARFMSKERAWELPISFETMRTLVKHWPQFHMSEMAHKLATKTWKEGKQELALLRYLRDLKEGKIDCSDVIGTTDLQPRPYQQVAIKFLEKAWGLGYGAANFDEQGLGKTCTILVALDRFLANHPDGKIVVFAPKSVLHSVWVAEIVRFTTRIRPLVLGGSIKHRAKMLTGVSHHDWARIADVNGVKRTQFIKRQGEPNLFLVNHEAGGRVMKTHAGNKANDLFQALIELTPEFVIVDEVHKISNTAANRTKSILAVARKARYIHGMTGTPGLPTNLYGILRFLDTRIFPVNKTDFERRYIDALEPTAGRTFRIVRGYKRLEELERRSSQFSIRRTQSECPDIPASIQVKLEVEMSKEQAEAYDATVKKIMAFYGDHDITKVNLPAQLHALRNITCGHIKDSRGQPVRLKTNGKLVKMLEFLDDELTIDPAHPEATRKAVIACAYTEDVELVSEALTKAQIKHVIITGEVEDTARVMARTEAASAFVEDPSVKVLVGITSTFGTGLNLVPRLPQVCDLMVFWSNNYSTIERDQAEKRIQRSGQTRMCRFVDPVCEDTIDETILEILASKKSIQDVISGDTLRFALTRGREDRKGQE